MYFRSMFSFTLEQEDRGSDARAGTIRTAHGDIRTPIFMPVGTAATVKAVHQHELTTEVGAQIILANTYHLYLRPGTDIIEQAGGIHSFNGWSGPILTDSGGFQVYSLAGSRKITEAGVTFQSHIDGSRHMFSPERAIDIQRSIGADIIMAFDECTPYPCERDYAERSMQLTHRWLQRCMDHFQSGKGLYGYEQTLLPIVQGSVYPDLRRQSAEVIASYDAPGNAIGGLSVGEPAPEMYALTKIVCDILPRDKPRYLMGVGTPANILACIARGVDMFDCVLPTRNARHGMLYTAQGIINMRNAKWKNDFSPVDTYSPASSSRFYTKAYLHHLMRCGEILGMQITSIHNLSFYLWLVGMARQHILDGTFADWYPGMMEQVSRRI